MLSHLLESAIIVHPEVNANMLCDHGGKAIQSVLIHLGIARDKDQSNSCCLRTLSFMHGAFKINDKTVVDAGKISHFCVMSCGRVDVFWVQCGRLGDNGQLTSL